MKDFDFEGIDRPRSGRWTLRLLIVFVLAIPAAIGFVAYRYLQRQQATAPRLITGHLPAVARAAATVRPATPTVEPGPPLPELDESDALVRKLVAALSARPGWASWIATEGLVRRFVVVVDNVAEGVSPHKHVGFLAPKGKYEAIDRRGTFVVDPQSYHRYDLIAGVVSSLDTKGCAETYRRMKPLVQQAYRDLGYPDRDFDATLARAIDRLVHTPAPQGDLALRPAVKSFKLADPRLEGLSPAQKQLMRMGPDNMQKVQQKLRELAEALSLPKN